MRSFLTFLFTLLFLSNGIRALEIEVSEKLVNAFKTIKKIEKAGGFELVKVEAPREKDYNFCVSCEDVSSLVTEVNLILQKVAEEEQKKGTDEDLVEKVSGLDALYHYTFNEYSILSRDRCKRFVDSNGDEGEKNVDLSNAVVLISDEIPLKNLNALQIVNGKKRTYFYRGKNVDKNLIIRIDVHGDENAKVTYYKLKERPSKAKSSNKKSKKKKKKEKWELWASSNESTESLDSSKEHLEYGAGFSIEHKDNIPKKLTLIEGSSYVTVAELFSLKTKTEISTKTQEVSLSVGDSKGIDYAQFQLDKDVLELKIPGEIDIFSSKLKLKTMYSVNTKDEQNMEFSIDGEEGSTTSLTLNRNDLGDSGSLTRTTVLGDGHRISLQLTSGEGIETKAWVKYKLAF